jgi:hypothetical protein
MPKIFQSHLQGFIMFCVIYFDSARIKAIWAKVLVICRRVEPNNTKELDDPNQAPKNTFLSQTSWQSVSSVFRKKSTIKKTGSQQTTETQILQEDSNKAGHGQKNKNEIELNIL